MREFLSKNPLLAGCLGLVGCATLVALALFVAAGFGLKKAADSVNLRPVALVQAASSAGLSLSYRNNNGVVAIELVPFEPREVSCEELWGIVLPNLKDPDVEMTLHSVSSYVLPDGSVQGVELECRRVIDEPPDGEPAEPAESLEPVDAPAR